MLSTPSLSMVIPVSPSGSATVIVMSPSSTATPLSVSFAVTSPAFPPFRPETGVALKSSSFAAKVAASTTTVDVAVSQLLRFRFSQIW